MVKAFWRKTYAKVLKQSRNLACRNGSGEGGIGILPRERRKKKSERLERRIFLEYTEKQALGQGIRQDFGQ